MIGRKQDWRMFVFLGIIFGIMFVCMGIGIIAGGSKEGFQEGMLACGIIFILVGLILAISAVVVFFKFANLNMGKKDDSIVVKFMMNVNGNVQPLDNADSLKRELTNLGDCKEILITLCPEYYGLMSWKFIKRRGFYISIVQIHKKDKYLQYFIMPDMNLESAVEPFLEVAVLHKAVDTSKLIDIKRYDAVMDYYKLRY